MMTCVCRAEIRAVLKQQMDDKQRSERFTMKEKVRESEAAVERDMQDRLKDSMDYQRRSEYLKTFTKDNKRVCISYYLSFRQEYDFMSLI